MKEITLRIERDEDSGWFVAQWDAPNNGGGITTQGKDLGELEANVREAVVCHFGKRKAPRTIRLHFVKDAVLETA
jgi:predicted RNase H-like HicB family nuclease